MKFCKIKNIHVILFLKKIYIGFLLYFGRLFKFFHLTIYSLYQGVYFIHFWHGSFLPHSFCSKFGTWKSYANSGFYSCYSLLLQGIIQCYKQGLFVTHIDTTNSFFLSKDDGHKHHEIFHQFFRMKGDFSLLSKEYFRDMPDIFLDWDTNLCHSYYRSLPYEKLTTLLNIYFLPSRQIQNRMQFFKEEYFIESENILAVVYRGTDKGTEVTLASPDQYLNLTKKILQKYPHLRVLIQTDQAQVRKLFCDTFGDKCFYIEELPVTESNTGVHYLLQDNKLDFTLNFDAVIRLISQSKILIINTGNVAFFLALYRGHAGNMYQFDKNGQLVEPAVIP